jgi:8-oxo-dGTP pyrophosphatase MutT (NUDIX family)
MNLLRHIERCNAFRPERFRAFRLGKRRIGFVRHDNAERLTRFPDIFAVTADEVRLVARGGFDELSAAIDRVVERLVADRVVAKWRNEFFAVRPGWDEPPVFKLDRGAISFFGVRASGVHLNGFRRDSSVKLWIGRRAADKKVDPNKLDNLVAGGIGHPYGIADTLVKEAEEEAGMPPLLARCAEPRGFIAYRMEWGEGVRDDRLYVYDLETPDNFIPRNQDGEIVQFSLMDAREVLARVAETEDFKFNVNLVVIDFALRHNLLPPGLPDYAAIKSGLHPTQN